MIQLQNLTYHFLVEFCDRTHEHGQFSPNTFDLCILKFNRTEIFNPYQN